MRVSAIIIIVVVVHVHSLRQSPNISEHLLRHCRNSGGQRSLSLRVHLSGAGWVWEGQGLFEGVIVKT